MPHSHQNPLCHLPRYDPSELCAVLRQVVDNKGSWLTILPHEHLYHHKVTMQLGGSDTAACLRGGWLATRWSQLSMSKMGKVTKLHSCCCCLSCCSCYYKGCWVNVEQWMAELIFGDQTKSGVWEG